MPSSLGVVLLLESRLLNQRQIHAAMYPIYFSFNDETQLLVSGVRSRLSSVATPVEFV